MPSEDVDESPTPPESRKRLVWSVGLAAGVVLAATVTIPTYADGGDRSRADQLQRRHDATVRALDTARAGSVPHTHSNGGPTAAGDGHTHDHSDPTTKNSVSRSTGDTVGAATKDPTTARQATAARQVVAAQRAEADPRIVPIAREPRRRAVPEDRYAMAGGCYALRATGNDRWVTLAGGGFRASSRRGRGGEPFHFQATDLGRYLMFGSGKDFVAKGSGDPLALTGSDAVEPADRASEQGDWTVTRRGSSYLFTLPGAAQGLAVDAAGNLVMAATPDPFGLHRTSGCARWPEVRTDVSGRPFRGASNIQEVRGYLDAHTHGMAFEFLGGEVHCGRPWHPYGVTAALVDCPDHQVANGNGAVLENLTKTGQPTGSHDPVGWPTFKDWPAPNSLTHEGTYYKWMERAWRGGERLFVNLLVENGQLCKAYPLKRNSCDEMDSIRLQAKRMRQFERYIDAQAGGPGEGWYHIVTDPFQARRAINQGKMAVIMGIETSVVFGCTKKVSIPDPSCTRASINRQLDEVYDLGVRQMELVNKFDNALSGVAGDNGTTGTAVNGANFAETGSFWHMSTCPHSYAPEVHDKNQITAPTSTPFTERDGLFGAIQDQFGVTPPALPLYAGAPHCNEEGLTVLGDHTIREMAQRNMIFDPDHMSVSGRKASLDLVEDLGYSGVVSSHSWATPDAYPRIYRLGGVITPYAGDSEGFVDKWNRHLGWADGRYYFGFGFGADMNGLGAQGDPRGADVPNPVTYPFKGLGGVTIGKQHSGKRVYDINVDGVAHYGLYPDWIEDLRNIAGNAIVQDMTRGPEAYLQMWERAVGVTNDACRDPRALRRAALIRNLPRGATARYVLRHGGQPHQRLGNTFSYCARADGRTTNVTVVFNGQGRLVRTT